MVRLSITDQCRCGPVTRPVAPTAPMRAPASTVSPAFTAIEERWQYFFNDTATTEIYTVLPLKK